MPTGENGTVPPARRTNAAQRPREHLFEHEVDKLRETARKRGRYGFRDAVMILIAYRHALRVAELCALRWDQIELDQAIVHVVRRKGGKPSVHPLRGDELRALRRLRREQAPPSPFVFTTERLAPMTTAGFRKMLARLGADAGFEFPVHPHMLRHGCGFQLQEAGTPTRVIQAWMGHVDIRHTVRYTELSADAFKEVWREKG